MHKYNPRVISFINDKIPNTTCLCVTSWDLLSSALVRPMYYIKLAHIVGITLKPSYTPVTLEAEWAGMPSEWKFVVHSWIFEVHSKNSDCILSAFQIFGPILVTGPNIFYHGKTFEVHSKWKNIERHSNCTLTAF